MIELTVNGEKRSLPTPTPLVMFLQQHNLHEKMVVVEHNFEIVPRDRYASIMLNAGDTLEIVQMMAGG